MSEFPLVPVACRMNITAAIPTGPEENFESETKVKR